MILIRFIILLMLLSVSSVQAQDLNTLLQQGQNYIVTGHYYEAIRQLDKAEKIATDDYHLTFIGVLKGYIKLQQQEFKKAEDLFVSALKQSTQQKWINLTAKTQLYLGQLYYRQNNSDEAVRYFRKIVEQSEKITEKSLLVSAYLHLSKVTQSYDSVDKINKLLQQSERVLNSLPENELSAKLWLDLGYQAFTLHQKKNNNNELQAAYRYLNKALAQAKHFKQNRLQASALHYLAQLYQYQQRTKEAIALTKKGIYLAQKQSANDILINLESLLANLLQTEHKLPDAINAYRRAVNHIEVIRLDIPVSYQQGRSSFRDTLAPIYLGLADLLLQQSAEVDASLEQTLLKEAQDMIELMKQSELEDFFQSRCEIATSPIDLKKTDPHAAAIYPISFKDRLDIIVYTSQGLKRFSSPVDAKRLEETARNYAKRLRDYADFSKLKPEAALLYQWLIQPLDAYLKQQKIETLVYIPDGALRLFPLASVYNGQKFLIEDYAVVTSPGMSLIESKTTQYEQQQAILFAGVSYPGDVIYDLPHEILSNMVEILNEGESEQKLRTGWLSKKKKRSTLLPNKDVFQSNKVVSDLRENDKLSKKIREELALPAVAFEIEGLSKKNNMPYLLDESFSLKNFSDTLVKKPYKILHIATHGIFGGTESESFIMAHDKILNVKKLQKLLAKNHFKKYPIDLLILSACQTAEGDDRSPLGISGVAIKAKVHSALGSLWEVDDKATAQLMMAFYDALKDPTLSKAQALRKAKLSLLKQKEFYNPAMWSPLILVGNWK